MWIMMMDELRHRMCEGITDMMENKNDIGALALVKNAIWRKNANGAVYVDRATALLLLEPREETDLLGTLVLDDTLQEDEENFRVVLTAIAGQRLNRYPECVD